MAATRGLSGPAALGRRVPVAGTPRQGEQLPVPRAPSAAIGLLDGSGLPALAAAQAEAIQVVPSAVVAGQRSVPTPLAAEIAQAASALVVREVVPYPTRSTVGLTLPRRPRLLLELGPRGVAVCPTPLRSPVVAAGLQTLPIRPPA